MKAFVSLLTGLLLLMTLLSCGGGGSSGGTPAVGTDSGGATLSSNLSGTQQVPDVITGASGSATLSIAANNSAIDFSLSVLGFTAPITAAHIHQAAAGQNGPVIFTLVTTDFTGSSSGSLTAVDAGVSMSLAEAIGLILSGDTYINIHTTANPAGEIRGQLGAQNFTIALEGAQEVPPVVTAMTGEAVVSINAAQDAIDFSLSLSGNSTDVTASHIHQGATGANGSVLATLLSSNANTATGTVVALDTGASLTFAEAIDLLLSGGAYVNVHTTGNAAGEIRGQIVP